MEERDDNFNWSVLGSSLPTTLADKYPAHSAKKLLDQFCKQMLKFVHPKNLKKKNVLDVGCSDGRFTQEMVRYPMSLTCVDNSEEMLNILRKRLIKVKTNCRTETVRGGIYSVTGKQFDTAVVSMLMQNSSEDINSIAQKLNDLKVNMVFVFEDITKGSRGTLNAFEGAGYKLFKSLKKPYKLHTDDIAFMAFKKNA